MAIADASQTQVSYVAESTAGTTPATPTLLKQRITGGGGMQAIQDFVTSNEVRADRMVSDVARVGRRSEGSYGFELSYGTFDDWLESLFQGAWSSDVLENGSTQSYFTVEEKLETGGTDNYKRFAGVQVNTMSLNIQAGSIVTGTFGLVGFGEPTMAQAAISGSSYTDANTNAVITASNDFGDLAITGLTSPKIQAISLNITNNLRLQPVVGDIDAAGVGSGRFQVSGSVTMYFENADAYDIFLANTYTDLAFRLGGASSEKYDFSLPRLKFTSAGLPIEGNDTDVPLTLEFTAVYDSTDGHAIEVTRTA